MVAENIDADGQFKTMFVAPGIHLTQGFVDHPFTDLGFHLGAFDMAGRKSGGSNRPRSGTAASGSALRHTMCACPLAGNVKLAFGQAGGCVTGAGLAGRSGSNRWVAVATGLFGHTAWSAWRSRGYPAPSLE